MVFIEYAKINSRTNKLQADVINLFNYKSKKKKKSSLPLLKDVVVNSVKEKLGCFRNYLLTTHIQTKVHQKKQTHVPIILILKSS